MPDERPYAEPLNLREHFPPLSTLEWEAAIRLDLKGADSRNLIWHSNQGIDVLPYYRSDALAGLEGQTSTVPGQFPFVRGTGRTWQINETGQIPEHAIRADLVLEAGGNSVQQLGIALAEGVERLASLNENRSVDVAAQELQFVFAIGSSYFFEIAKLRAARMLWAHAVDQFQPADPSTCRMNLHARTARINKSLSNPHTNLLRATTEAMSAIIGGCDSLIIEPFGFAEHLAVNIQRILAEEAHLGGVADPGGGSYYLEALTASLARAGWALFQRIEAQGGYTPSRSWCTEEIERSCAAREQVGP